MPNPPQPTERMALEASEPRFRAVLEIARAIGTTLDLDELLAVAMAKITELLDAERSTLFLVDREHSEIRSKIAQGTEREEIRLPLGRGLAGFVAETGRIANVKNAYEDPRFNADVDRITGFQTTSMLAVALRGKDGGVIGVAQALNKRGGGVFGLDDERTLSSVSHLIGVALENAQLYSAMRQKHAELGATQSKLRQKVAEVDLLFEIEREISAATTLDALLEAILERAMSTVSADRAALLLVGDDGPELHVKAGPSSPLSRREGPIAYETSLARIVEARGEPSDASLLGLAGLRSHASLCVPLVVQGRGEPRVVGALELADKVPGEFTGDDRKLATLVAAQIARAVTLARARAESERAGRLAALGQMLGGIVHDLRSPLTVVSGYAELMARESDERERAKYADQILSQVDHVNGMTREVLAFIRGERQLLVRRVQVTQFWKDLEIVLSRELESTRMRLVIESPYAGVARFDESKMRRLVTNLARNAAQAGPGGGRFHIRCESEGDALVLRFADDGPGIPAHVASRLFTAFNSHGKAGGTGLGLALVKEVVDAHGGQVTFTTAAGQGTTFEVRLPGAVA